MSWLFKTLTKEEQFIENIKTFLVPRATLAGLGILNAAGEQAIALSEGSPNQNKGHNLALLYGLIFLGMYTIDRRACERLALEVRNFFIKNVAAQIHGVLGSKHLSSEDFLNYYANISVLYLSTNIPTTFRESVSKLMDATGGNIDNIRGLQEGNVEATVKDYALKLSKVISTCDFKTLDSYTRGTALHIGLVLTTDKQSQA